MRVAREERVSKKPRYPVWVTSAHKKRAETGVCLRAVCEESKRLGSRRLVVGGGGVVDRWVVDSRGVIDCGGVVDGCIVGCGLGGLAQRIAVFARFSEVVGVGLFVVGGVRVDRGGVGIGPLPAMPEHHHAAA